MQRGVTSTTAGEANGLSDMAQTVGGDTRSVEGPSLRTDRNGFHYRLMLGYDAGDPTYDDPVLLAAVGKMLRELLRDTPVSVHAVRYGNENRGAPCWIWNKLFGRACAEGASYFYQLNDDLLLVTEGWASRFVNALRSNDPPDVGITGPLDLNNERLMTQSFASCSHFDIFGFYYPWRFKNWYSDDWAAQLYAEHTYWHTDIEVDHSLTSGPRYRINYEHGAVVKPLLKSARRTICSWLANRTAADEDAHAAHSTSGLLERYSFCSAAGQEPALHSSRQARTSPAEVRPRDLKALELCAHSHSLRSLLCGRAHRCPMPLRLPLPDAPSCCCPQSVAEFLPPFGLQVRNRLLNTRAEMGAAEGSAASRRRLRAMAVEPTIVAPAAARKIFRAAQRTAPDPASLKKHKQSFSSVGTLFNRSISLPSSLASTMAARRSHASQSAQGANESAGEQQVARQSRHLRLLAAVEELKQEQQERGAAL